ncbi:MAG: carbohydrate kinase [Nitrososphaerota archaeon]
MIFAIGEVLIDFFATEEAELKHVRRFEKHAGGAPANVVVGLRRLNVPSTLISKIGKDAFGEYLIECLRDEGVNTRYIYLDQERNTGIVFIQHMGAEPSFLLYDNVAYFNLKLEEIDISFVNDADLLHFGGVLLARDPSRSTCLQLAQIVKNHGIKTSFDANIRLSLWRDRVDELVKCMEKSLSIADIVKLGKEESKFLEENGVDLKGFNIRLTTITMGEKGSKLIYDGITKIIPAYKVRVVNPIGAGDSYLAGMLAGLHAMGKLKELSLNEQELELVGRFANIVAAISTTKKGAMSTPKLSSLRKFKEVRTIVDKLMNTVHHEA